MSAKRQYWMLVVSASLILAVTMGIRRMGLFVSPLNSSTGLGIVTISFALAVGQFVWGVAQPMFGALADRDGPVRIIRWPVRCSRSAWRSRRSCSTLGPDFVSRGRVGGRRGRRQFFGAHRRRRPAAAGAARVACGMISAGGSFGQFVFAPLAQALIAAFGWVAALITLALRPAHHAARPAAARQGGRPGRPRRRHRHARPR